MVMLRCLTLLSLGLAASASDLYRTSPRCSKQIEEKVGIPTIRPQKRYAYICPSFEILCDGSIKSMRYRSFIDRQWEAIWFATWKPNIGKQTVTLRSASKSYIYDSRWSTAKPTEKLYVKRGDWIGIFHENIDEPLPSPIGYQSSRFPDNNFCYEFVFDASIMKYYDEFDVSFDLAKANRIVNWKILLSVKVEPELSRPMMDHPTPIGAQIVQKSYQSRDPYVYRARVTRPPQNMAQIQTYAVSKSPPISSGLVMCGDKNMPPYISNSRYRYMSPSKYQVICVAGTHPNTQPSVAYLFCSYSRSGSEWRVLLDNGEVLFVQDFHCLTDTNGFVESHGSPSLVNTFVNMLGNPLVRNNKRTLYSRRERYQQQQQRRHASYEQSRQKLIGHSPAPKPAQMYSNRYQTNIPRIYTSSRCSNSCGPSPRIHFSVAYPNNGHDNKCPGDYVIYQCIHGYKLENLSKIQLTCTLNGWLPLNQPRCIRYN